jgi:hypothetical protein
MSIANDGSSHELHQISWRTIGDTEYGVKVGKRGLIDNKQKIEDGM